MAKVRANPTKKTFHVLNVINILPMVNAFFDTRPTEYVNGSSAALNVVSYGTRSQSHVAIDQHINVGKHIVRFVKSTTTKQDHALSRSPGLKHGNLTE